MALVNPLVRLVETMEHRLLWLGVALEVFLYFLYSLTLFAV